MKLKTAIDYTLTLFKTREKEINKFEHSKTVFINLVLRYANFLKQLLQLWMFIPCDKDGKPLEKPVNFDKYANKNKFKLNNLNVSAEWIKECKEYQQACDRKIFTGFELYQDTYFNSYNCVIRNTDMVIVNIENKTIEDIAKFKVEVTDRISKQFKY